MSVAPTSTAPTKSRTVNGFNPSVIIALLLRWGWTRHPQGVGLAADKATCACATPVPGAPIDFRFVPALQQAVHHDAAGVGAELRQGGEKRGHGVSPQCHGVLRVERPLSRRSEEHTSELQSLTNLVC